VIEEEKSMEKKQKAKRKLYFRFLKNIMKIKYKKPRFIYLGEEFENGALILSNHEGTDAPMSLEIYCDKPIRMWGTAEMNSGLRKLYRYQTRVYYYEKKHWNIYLARLFCLLASPLTWLFYSGFDLISTYKDARLIKTIRESAEAIRSGDNVVIFPEDSKNGYLPVLEGFYSGFDLLCKYCAKNGIDLPIYVSYFRKSDCTYIFDKPINYSELTQRYKTREEISAYLCNRCNELGKMNINKN
jgi:hypothetical protein